MPVAHLVAPATVPGIAGSILCLLGAFAGIHLLRIRRGRGRAAAAVLTCACLAGMIGLEAAAAAPSGTIGLAGLAPGAHVESPVVLTVCRSTARGASPVTLPRGGWLSVSVDGGRVPDLAAGDAVLTLPFGVRRIAVDLLDRVHRELSPPLRAVVTVFVIGTASSAHPARCR